MANETSNTDSGVKVLGKIEGIQGNIIVVDSNGVKSPGQVGQSLPYGSTVKTMGSSVVLLSVDGHGVVSLGHDEELTLDQELLALLDQILEEGIGEGVNFELIAQALEGGESIEDLLQAPAAGGSPDGSSSSSAGSAARVELTAGRITPESGFETSGLTRVATQTNAENFQQFNNPPSTTGIADVSIDEDVPVSFDLSQSFSDIDVAQSLQFTVSSLPEGLSFDPQTGVLSGTPTNDAAFSQDGQYLISVTATDNSGFVNNSVTTTFNLNVNNVNDAPIAGAPIDLGQINEDQSIVFNATQLLAGSSDIDASDILTVSGVSLVSGEGEVIDNGDGTFTFTPSENWFGNPQFSYTVSDGQGGEAENTISLAVDAVNDAPIANADSLVSTVPLTSVNVNALGNDTDVDGDDLSITGASATSGSVVIESDGTLTYTPNDGFFGTDTIQYTLSDGNGGESQTTIPVSVVYDPGVVTINNSDTVNTNTPSFSGTSANIQGDITLTVNGVDYSVTPASDGSWNFTIPAGASLPDGNYQVSVSGTDILSNDSTATDDFIVDALLPTVTIVDQNSVSNSFPTFEGTSANTDGDFTLSVNGVDYTVTPQPNGDWSFTLPAALPDGDYTAQITVSDAQGNTASADDLFVVDAFAPEVTIDDQSVVSGTVIFSGTSANTDGDLMLTVDGMSYSVTPAADGSWTFTLPPSDVLPDGNYTATIIGNDAQGNSASDRDDFVVDNDIPIVTINNLDTVDSPLPTFSGTSANIDGYLTLTVNGIDYTVTPDATTGAWVFTIPDPDALADGNYTASISGSDLAGNVSNDSDDFVIDAVDDIPAISGDTAGSVTEDDAATLTVSGDLDAAGGDPGEDQFNPETLNGTYGELEINAAGEWTFTADNSQAAIQALAPGQTLTDTFTVTNADGVTTQDIVITINGNDDVPTITGDTTGSVTEDDATMLTTSGDLDAAGGDSGEDQFNPETLTGTYGELEINAAGEWTFTADNSQAAIQALAPGQTLTNTFTVTNADGVTTQDIVITINGNDDVPTITGDTSGSVTEDAAATLTTSGDLDAAGGDAGEDQFNPETLTGTYGELEINAAGEWTYEAVNSQAAIQALAPGQTLTDTFTVTNADGVTTQDIVITINGNDDVPTITGDTAGSVTEDDAATLTVSGDLDATGGDAGEDQFNPETLNGTYGDLTINAAGEWTYSAVNSQAAIQALAPGQTLTESFTVTNADGVTTQDIVITINGNDDVPTITGDTTGSVTEDDAAMLTTSGDLDAAGGDVGEDQFNPETLNGTYGELEINAAGEWTFTADNSQAAIQALAPGQTLTDTFTVTNADGVTTQDIVITINGNDDVPTITGDTSGSVTEDAAATLTTSGDLDAAGGDAGEDQFNAETLTGTYGELEINAAGEWTFTADNSQAAIQALAPGQTLTETFTVTNADGVTTQDIVITINGNDDVPTITGDTTGSVTEDDAATLTTSGDLDAAGGDAGEDRFNAETLTGTYGELEINAAGEWTFTADNSQAAIQALAPGQTLTDTFTVTNADGVTTQDIVITINGNDDVPTITGDTAGSVTEDDAATLTVSGDLDATGGDAGEDQFNPETLNGTYGDLTINAAGEWTYSAVNSQAAIQALAPGQTLTESFTVTNADGVTTQDIVITINGNDDVPTITGDTTGSVTEDDAAMLTTSGDLDAAGGDVGEDQFNPETLNGTYGELEINAAGEWTFTADNSQAAIQALAPGQTLTDTFTVTNADGVTTQDIVITINGNDDVPTITGDTAGSVTEDDAATLTTSGDLDAAGGDAGEDQFNPETLNGTYGELEINAAGEWTFTADNSQAAIQSLAPGQTLTDTFTVTNADGVTTQDIVITINGNDDVPTITGDTTGSVTEDDAATLTTSGDLDAAGGDAGEDQFNPETLTGTYGELEINAAGEWTFTADNSQAAIQALAPGQTLTDTFTVTNADGVTTQDIVITINGNDDVPTITGDTTGSVTEDDAAALTVSGDLDAAGGDAGEDQFNAETLTGTYGDLTINAAGEWTYSAVNSQAAIQALAPGQTLTETFTVTNADGVTTQDIVITINGNDDVPTITGDTTGSVTEDAAATLTVSGDLDASGGDAGEDQFNPETLTGTYGELEINAAGEWTFTADNSQAAIQALAPGQTLTDTFTVTNADGVTTQDIVITINGNDDVPTITGDTTGSVTEDDATFLRVSGDLDAAGGDAGEDLFTPQTQTATYGVLIINANGGWEYSVDNGLSAIQALAPGQTITETFTVTNADGVTTQDIVITINGNDDVPTITGDTAGSVTEDDAATLTVSGDLDAAGGDAGEDEFTDATLTGTYGTLEISRNGEWRYSADNSQTAIQQLAVGVALTDTFTVLNADGVTAETVAITINGADDVPTITGDTTGLLTEDDAPSLTVTGDLDASGGDAGEDLFVPETITGTYGELTIDANGNWSYSAANDQEAIQRLTDATDNLTDTITVTNADGVTTQDIVITIRGDLNGVPDVFVDDSDITPTTVNLDFEFVGDDFDPTPQDDFTDAGGVDPANLSLNSESNVTVNFVSESAGFSSSIGWYQIDDSGRIVNTEFIWADSNNISSADESITLNNVSEGRIGFFLVQNGFSDVNALLSRGSGFFRFEDSAGNPATTSTPGAVLVYYSDGDENSPAGFRLELPPTLHASNPNLNPDGLEHSDSGVDAGDPSRLVIGFEDLIASDPSSPNSGVDWDLRDFVFSIEISGVAQNVASVASNLEIVDDGTDLQAAAVNLILGREADQLTLLDVTEDLAASYGITVEYDAVSRTLNFSGTASIAQYEEILSQIQVASSETLGSEPRQVEVRVTDTDGNTSVVNTINLNADASYSFDQDDFIAGNDDGNLLSGLVGDDVIFGGLGNDTATGGSGADTFVWQAGDEASSAVDTITDFTIGVGGDVLDVSDLLQGESDSALVLDDYLDFSSDGTDTTISIDVDGDGSGADMTIVLQGVDLTTFGADQSIIQNLIDNNNIITD
ncbi:retention module-containing protein [Agarilytica rhodophyticola]|uniref:retention module-containing protein n=1 Tax=Agarilytica rhodophyticola TaxID=1737490 RepID=UPI000B3F259B|nr:retention module-containing protein [Agarilytica rhodophyticola]